MEGKRNHIVIKFFCIRTLTFAEAHFLNREYLYKSFYQLRLYGREDISVMAACMEALTMLVKTGDSSVLKEVESFSRYMEQAVDEEQLADWDREYWEKRVQEKDTALHQALTKSKQIT